MISPASVTIWRAPARIRSSLIGSVCPLGAPFNFGSAEIDRCVFAIHTGKFQPLSAKRRAVVRVIGPQLTSPARYSDLAMFSTLSKKDSSSSYSSFISDGWFAASTTASASSIIPAPPSVNPLASSTPLAPAAIATSLATAISSGESPGNRLIATTAGRPYIATILRAFLRFSAPLRTASGSGASMSLIATPPCHLRPRMVATTTAAEGLGPPCRTLISMNFSKPRSAPNPASVTT